MCVKASTPTETFNELTFHITSFTSSQCLFFFKKKSCYRLIHGQFCPFLQNQVLNLGKHRYSINSWISKRTPVNAISMVKAAVPVDVIISTWQHLLRLAGHGCLHTGTEEGSPSRLQRPR